MNAVSADLPSRTPSAITEANLQSRLTNLRIESGKIDRTLALSAGEMLTLALRDAIPRKLLKAAKQSEKEVESLEALTDSLAGIASDFRALGDSDATTAQSEAYAQLGADISETALSCRLYLVNTAPH